MEEAAETERQSSLLLKILAALVLIAAVIGIILGTAFLINASRAREAHKPTEPPHHMNSSEREQYILRAKRPLRLSYDSKNRDQFQNDYYSNDP